MIKKTEEEINDMIDEALETPEDKFGGMSYIEGVKTALEWVMGYEEDSPLED